MTTDEITHLVVTTAKEFDFGKNDTKLLVRYFVYKYCCWMTQSAIGKLFGGNIYNVCRGIKTVETRSEYAFIKLRIHDVIKQQIK